MNLEHLVRELEQQRRDRWDNAAAISKTMVLSTAEVADRLAAGDTEDDIRTDVDLMMRLGYSANTVSPYRVRARLARAQGNVGG